MVHQNKNCYALDEDPSPLEELNCSGWKDSKIDSCSSMGLSTTPNGLSSSPDQNGLSCTPDGLSSTPDGLSSTPEGLSCTPDELSSTLKNIDYMADYQPIQRVDIPQSGDKTFKARLRNSRRYSSPTGPPNMKSPTKPAFPIPQVVITDHDENDENQKMKRVFKRSLSTPDALTPYAAQCIQDSSMYPIISSGISMASIASTGQDRTYVTLEDVAPFKFRGRRKISSGSSIFSTDERIFLSEDAWSYTNCSSDTRTDTDAGSETDEKKCVSEVGLTGSDLLEFNKDLMTGGDLLELNKDLVDMLLIKPEEDKPINGDTVNNDATDAVQSANLDDDICASVKINDDITDGKPSAVKREKSSRWKKLSRMVKWTPFIQTYRKRKYPWVQLAGHSGSFIRGSQGTVLKKCGDQEEVCYRLLMQDPLSLVVPRYHRNVIKEGRKYLEIDCCLSEFNNPSIMDIKMGVRTFLVGETSVSKPRCDLYEKMISEDPTAPTELEQKEQAITKYRYLDWRDCISSSRQLGFRIEATTSKGKSTKDFKSVRTESQVETILSQFSDNESTMKMYLERLRFIKSLCSSSNFFSRHEMIGSSLLFIHDEKKASVWMIDFEKSNPVPSSILHNVPWELGNREDGYLIGLNSIISIFENLCEKSPE